MQFVRKISVANAMIMLAFLGILGITAYAGVQIGSAVSELRDLRNDERLTRISATVGVMTHELQKERGASAGFIASGGQNFADALPKQRELSDQRIAEYRAAVNALRAESQVPAGLDTMLLAVDSQIEGLRSLRGRVDRLEVELLDAVGTITRLNRAAIALLPEIGKGVSQSDAARAVQRHSIFMTAKDIVGLERATGSAAFARAEQGLGVIPPPILDRFSGLISQQETLLSIYQSIASPEMAAALQDLAASAPVTEVATLREIAFSNDAEQILTVSAEHWFATITKMINGIKVTEDAAAAEIGGYMSAALIAKRGDLMRFFVQWALLSALVAVMSVVLVKGASTSLTRTAKRVEALANGDLDSDVVLAPQTDLRKITEALLEFRDGALEKREEDKRQEELQGSSAVGVKRICAAVSNGDFSQRMKLRNLQGANLVLGDGINKILEVAEGVLNDQKARDQKLLQERGREAEAQKQAVADLNHVVRACSSGDFSKRMRAVGLDPVWQEVAAGINQIADMTGAVLSDFKRIMTALSHGDLSARMPMDLKGTFAEIGEATNSSLEQLKHAFSDIDASVESIGDMASQLKSGMSDLANRSDEQARTVAESSQATDDLSETLTANGARLNSCQDLISALEGKTAEGQEVATQAVESMSDIESVSSEMGKIVATIEEIAFQTNLLALNASVEAARAGETGRGFAVVASEVRALAGRCAEASQQVGQLIDQSVAGVNRGADNVRRTGEAIGAIQETTEAVLAILADLASAGQRQNDGVARLNDAIGQLDRTAQSNVSLARENNNLTEALSDVEGRLSLAVGGFLNKPTDTHGAKFSRSHAA